MIKALQIDERRMSSFIRVPFSHYGAGELWCPRSSAEIASWFRGIHPLSPSIGFIPFLALREGKPAGRCAAFIARGSDPLSPPEGAVGLYECENDEEVSGALLDAALSALAAAGCRIARGPVDGSIWCQYRFMVSGFGGKAFYGEPRNKPWHPVQFEAAGFSPVKSWASAFLDARGEAALLSSLARHRDRALAAGYSLRHPDPKRIDAEFRSIHAMIMESYSGFLGFLPIDGKTFSSLFRGLGSIWDPDLVHIAVAPDGKDAGFNIVLADPGRGVRAMRGSSSPLAVLRFLMNRDPRADHVDLYLGALPSAVRRGSGAGALLGAAACEAAMKAGRGFVMALVSDSSTVNSRIPEGAAETHRYALYERSLDERT
jgi:hypothetical protein